MSLISFQSENGFTLKNPDLFEQWIVGEILSNDKVVGELNYIFCDDDYLLKINIEHLDHDTLTDIITFDYCEDEFVHGDIFISTNMVENNAKEYGVSFNEELSRVMIHGVHHLLGQGDKTEEDASEMRVKENHSLSKRPKELV